MQHASYLFKTRIWAIDSPDYIISNLIKKTVKLLLFSGKCHKWFFHSPLVYTYHYFYIQQFHLGMDGSEAR